MRKNVTNHTFYEKKHANLGEFSPNSVNESKKNKIKKNKKS